MRLEFAYLWCRIKALELLKPLLGKNLRLKDALRLARHQFWYVRRKICQKK